MVFSKCVNNTPPSPTLKLNPYSNVAIQIVRVKALAVVCACRVVEIETVVLSLPPRQIGRAHV